MKRPLKVHSARFQHRHNRVAWIAFDDTRVTCLRCMYWMRRYIPLSRLREHQAAQRQRHEFAARCRTLLT